MPLYEYQCESCSQRLEKIQKFSDPPLETCPACGGALKKLLSSPAIQFKGSGWYITDYAKKSTSDAGKSSGKAADGGETAAKADAPAADAAKTSSGSTTPAKSE